MLVVVGHRLAQTGTAGTPEAVAPLEVVSEPSPAASGAARNQLVVHVVGAVRRPGLFRLREGARVADAVARAGGATRRADLSALNLAAPLVDGIQVLVPARVPVARGSPGDGDSVPESSGVGSGSGLGFGSGSETTGPAGRKVSLASATAEELDALPGVGPVTAQNILEYRSEHGPFRSVDDLDAVPGIGPTRIEQLRDLVTP